jgi:hypothetical protein
MELPTSVPAVSVRLVIVEPETIPDQSHCELSILSPEASVEYVAKCTFVAVSQPVSAAQVKVVPAALLVAVTVVATGLVEPDTTCVIKSVVAAIVVPF